MPRLVQISQLALERAYSRFRGRMNKNSFLDGEGNLTGFLGEEMFKTIFPAAKHVDSIDYDFLSENGVKVEVKTKKQNAPSEPLKSYEGSVAETSCHQNPDFYSFFRVYFDGKTFPYGWYMGSISRASLYKYGTKLKQGEKNGNNGFSVKVNCINIPYSFLSEKHQNI